ncbi:MAG: hypothetical protein K2P68_06010 [Sphingomonas sp.]|nr:hypothetical protein [Sphingomonas sp.]
MPFAKLFRSRWSAMLWAGGIIWLAYDVAGSAPQVQTATATDHNATEPALDATGAPVSADDLNTLAHFGDQSGGN